MQPQGGVGVTAKRPPAPAWGILGLRTGATAKRSPVLVKDLFKFFFVAFVAIVFSAFFPFDMP